MSLCEEINQFYQRDHWVTISVDVTPAEARYESETYRRIRRWCDKHTDCEVLIQPAIYGQSGRIYLRFFYDDHPERAKNAAMLCRLWLNP